MRQFPIAYFILVLLVSACGQPNNTSRQIQPVTAPAAYTAQQRTPEIVLQPEFYATQDSLHFLLRFEDVQQTVDVAKSAAMLTFDVRSGQAERDPLLFQDSVILGKKLTDADGQLYVKVALEKQFIKEPNILHVRLWQKQGTQDQLGMKQKVALKVAMLRKNYLLTFAKDGKPVFKPYIRSTDKLQVRRFSESTDTMQIHRFAPDFATALPPMSAKQPAALPKKVALDTLFAATNDTLQFSEEGLYVLAPGSGFSKAILVKAAAYPQLTTSKEMLEPLIYLTTSAERQKLLQTTNTKKAIDEFWLGISDNKAQARDLIREFYLRVEAANRLYTSHKPGWATDQGMIYIIFGKPANISYAGANTTWVYRQSETSPNMRFVFTKKEDNFTENNYELVRRREYEESWYNTVAKWRAGITNL